MLPQQSSPEQKRQGSPSQFVQLAMLPTRRYLPSYVDQNSAIEIVELTPSSFPSRRPVPSRGPRWPGTACARRRWAGESVSMIFLASEREIESVWPWDDAGNLTLGYAPDRGTSDVYRYDHHNRVTGIYDATDTTRHASFTGQRLVAHCGHAPRHAKPSILPSSRLSAWSAPPRGLPRYNIIKGDCWIR